MRQVNNMEGIMCPCGCDARVAERREQARYAAQVFEKTLARREHAHDLDLRNRRIQPEEKEYYDENGDIYSFIPVYSMSDLVDHLAYEANAEPVAVIRIKTCRRSRADAFWCEAHGSEWEDTAPWCEGA